ncbi:MAG: hypothetical protein M0P71_00780 [Melioribacteraceae bacterium]|nr:hypothetical protein [Melioribacteraceae bacterium]
MDKKEAQKYFDKTFSDFIRNGKPKSIINLMNYKVSTSGMLYARNCDISKPAKLPFKINKNIMDYNPEILMIVSIENSDMGVIFDESRKFEANTKITDAIMKKLMKPKPKQGML